MRSLLLARPRALAPLRCSSRRARQSRASKLQVEAGEREAKESGNQALARRILTLLGGDTAAFRELQAQTSRYRAGWISAGELQQRFHGALGGESDSILACVAGLMPPGRSRTALLAAAAQGGPAADGDGGWVPKPLAQPTAATLDSLERAKAAAAAEPPATAAGPPDGGGGAQPKQRVPAPLPLMPRGVRLRDVNVSRELQASKVSRQSRCRQRGVRGLQRGPSRCIPGSTSQAWQAEQQRARLAQLQTSASLGCPASARGRRQRASPPPLCAPPCRGRLLRRSRRVKPRLAADEPKAARGANVLLWLRSDLRLHDNPALDAAARRARQLGGQLAFCFVHSPAEDGDDLASGTSWRPTGASLVWQQAGLQSLDADLRARFGPGAGIVFLRGPYAPALGQAARALGVGALFFSRRYEPAMRATDARVEAALKAEGLEVRSLNTALLHEPAAVQLSLKGRWTGHFGTLSPFLRACDKLGSAGKPLPPPQSLPVAAEPPAQAAGGLALEELGLVQLPRRRDGSLVRWDASLLDAWRISEAAALDTLEQFADTRLPAYEASRHFADGRAVSALSPYIHHGQLSPRQVLATVAAHGGPQASKTFWRRLVWRDLAYWQLHHWPAMAAQPMRPHYAAQEWREDPAALEAWRRGRTGFPLVDAGMRQLWATGWMQQSVRMVCALFLTEYLNLHWLHGCRWFHECLVDADLAINSMMWQNAGKSGLDQWNFTLLPTSSSQDPDGSYVARWVPEVAQLPKKWRHQPWAAPEAARAAAGLVLGQTYPHRITGSADVRELRKENQRAICEMRAAAGRECTDAGGYDVIRVPQGATREGDGQTIRVFTKREYRGAGAGAREPRAAKA